MHSTYCDGVDTPEEAILAAIEKGFTSIGFSGHSYMHYSPDHSMSVQGTEDYKKEITLHCENVDFFDLESMENIKMLLWKRQKN